MSVHHGGRGPGHISRWTKAAGASGPSTALVTTGSLDARITASGGANGTRVNSSGLIVAATCPRFDHTSAGVPLGVLVEEERTNLTLWSEDVSNAAWTLQNTTASVNAAVSPDGNTTADLIYPTASGAQALVFKTAPIASGGGYVSSWFVKYSGIRWAWLATDNPVLAQTAWFDVQNGAVGTVGASLIGSGMESYGNGWYRCWISYTALTNYCEVGLSDADNSQAVTKNGTDGIYGWGAQIEAGSFATSYIPTAGATVTRTADSLSMTGTDFSSWYNQSEGSFIATAISPASGTRAILSADNNTANEVIKLYTSTADPKMLVTDGGATQADIDAGSITALTSFKLGGAYKVNDFAVSVNGGAEVTDAAGTIPTPDRLRIGVDQAGNYLNGPIAALSYYATRVSLQSLTT